MQLILCTANHKGGSGKTTTALLVAATLSSPTYRVAVVDLDPQGSATIWAAAGDGKFPATVVPAKAANLAEVLVELKGYDAVLLDCPPSSTAPETLAALDASHLIVVPCGASPLDYWATDAMVNAAALRCPNTPVLVVVNNYTHTKLSAEMAGHIATTWPTARARLTARTVYREAAALGVGLRQMPGRTNRDALNELDALSLELLTNATKAIQQ